uniref:NLP1-9 GAF domain-containing protein n=2 Tax=Arundo donax TaxID=35708 RepID=A0A0A9EPB3_ARUDO
MCNEGHQAALVEMLEIVTVICEELKLPLAQTWVTCKYQNLQMHCGGVKKRGFNAHGSCVQELCMSTSDVAFHVVDARMWRFRDACATYRRNKECPERHLSHVDHAFREMSLYSLKWIIPLFTMLVCLN